MLRARLADGTELAYELRGTGEPIVCIHGALIADSFRTLAAEPALAHFQLVLYHRRGYSQSDKHGELTFAQHARDCAGLLDHLGIARAHVLGHSLGGSVALELARTYPERVHTLGLLEPGLFVGTTAAGYREALVQNRRRFQELGAEVVVDEFLRVRFGADYRAWLPADLLEQAVENGPLCFERELLGSADWTMNEADLRRITQPAFAVVGDKSDALWPRFGETYRVVLGSLPNVEGFVLPHATHALQLENPHDLAGPLAAFYAAFAILSTTS